MAYLQTPGRGQFPKTGYGIPEELKQVDPEQAKKLEDRSKKAVESYKSNKSLSKSDLDIEKAAASDSIVAANPKNAHLFSAREKGAMGWEAAQATREANKSGKSVTKTEVFSKKTGYEDSYKSK